MQIRRLSRSLDKKNLIEDTANTPGADYKNYKVGSLGDVGFFFIFTKISSTLEVVQFQIKTINSSNNQRNVTQKIWMTY